MSHFRPDDTRDVPGRDGSPARLRKSDEACRSSDGTRARATRITQWGPVVPTLLVWLALVQPATLPHPLLFSDAAHRDFHLRVLDVWLEELVAEAKQRSTTFASLVSRVEATDLIVYVERVMTLPRALRGQIGLAASQGPVRYVRVNIRANQSRDDSAATLAHELQHAVEIGKAREVRSEADLSALYQRIGEEHDRLRFETNEADSVGRQVLVELIAPH